MKTSSEAEIKRLTRDLADWRTLADAAQRRAEVSESRTADLLKALREICACGRIADSGTAANKMFDIASTAIAAAKGDAA